MRLRCFFAVQIVLTVALFCGIGAAVGLAAKNYYNERKKEEFLEKAQLIAVAVNPRRITTLKAGPEDKESPDYQRLKEQLTLIGNTFQDARYIYIMGRKGDSIFFYIDSQPTKFFAESDIPLAEPGEVYDDVDEQLFSVFDGKGSLVTTPYTDKWGTFVSALIELKNIDSGEFVGVLGVDIDNSTWRREELVVFGSVVAIFVLMGLGAALLMLLNRGQAGAKAKEALLASIADSSDDAIISKTVDGTILSWNVGAENLYGYSQEEAVGKNITLIVPEDRRAELKEIMNRVREGERILRHETHRVTKNGKDVTVSLTVSPLRDSQGKVYAMSVIARDVTQASLYQKNLEEQRKKLEEANKLMVDRELKMVEIKKELDELRSGSSK